MEIDELAAKLRLAWYDYQPVIDWMYLSPHVRDKWRRVAKEAVKNNDS